THTFRKPRMLLPRDGGENGDDGVTEHPSRVEVLLREALPRDAVAVEALQIFERLQRAFSAEPVQCPKKDEIKLLQPSILEHALELGTVGSRAGHSVGVLDVLPALTLAVFDKL